LGSSVGKGGARFAIFYPYLPPSKKKGGSLLRMRAEGNRRLRISEPAKALISDEKKKRSLRNSRLLMKKEYVKRKGEGYMSV